MERWLEDKVKATTAKDRLTHISSILQIYGRQMTIMLCSVGDNSNVNQSFAYAMSIYLVAKGSNKFNSDVQKGIKGLALPYRCHC
jgi:hypothetical protein